MDLIRILGFLASIRKLGFLSYMALIRKLGFMSSVRKFRVLGFDKIGELRRKSKKI